jgi:hypothetical protein
MPAAGELPPVETPPPAPPVAVPELPPRGTGFELGFELLLQATVKQSPVNAAAPTKSPRGNMVFDSPVLDTRRRRVGELTRPLWRTVGASITNGSRAHEKVLFFFGNESSKKKPESRAASSGSGHARVFGGRALC